MTFRLMAHSFVPATAGFAGVQGRHEGFPPSAKLYGIATTADALYFA